MSRGGPGWLESWRNVSVLFRYWLKGRLSKSAVIWILLGEGFSIIFVSVVGGSFLSFAARFSVNVAFSGFAVGLVLAFILIGLLQSGFAGSGLPVTSADVDYVFTAPLSPREVFAAKVLMNSLTTVLFSFPPILFLYLKLSAFYQTQSVTAVFAGLVTLVFLVMALVLSADVTLSLSSGLGPRLKPIRNALIALVVVMSLIPVVLMIPGSPRGLNAVSEVLPSGLAANISIGLVSGVPWNLGLALDLVLLFAWFGGALLLGIRMSRNYFYEVVQVVDGEPPEQTLRGGKTSAILETDGKSVWSVVRRKEEIVMKRTRERRGLIISTLFLSGFMVIYSLAGTFQSSPGSFLFILFLIGSFGSGNANGWLEKERLWIIRTSSLDLRRYVRQVFRARVTPLLLLLTPVTVAVGVPLIVGRLGHSSSLLGVVLTLPVALEIAAVMMGGGMYFASKYGQSTADDILTSQAQQLTDVKLFLYQTVINLALVAPLMGLVLSVGTQLFPPSPIPFVPLVAILLGVSVVYTYEILRRLLNAAGDSIRVREDL